MFLSLAFTLFAEMVSFNESPDKMDVLLDLSSNQVLLTSKDPENSLDRTFLKHAANIALKKMVDLESLGMSANTDPGIEDGNVYRFYRVAVLDVAFDETCLYVYYRTVDTVSNQTVVMPICKDQEMVSPSYEVTPQAW